MDSRRPDIRLGRRSDRPWRESHQTLFSEPICSTPKPRCTYLTSHYHLTLAAGTLAILASTAADIASIAPAVTGRPPVQMANQRYRSLCDWQELPEAQDPGRIWILGGLGFLSGNALPSLSALTIYLTLPPRLLSLSALSLAVPHPPTASLLRAVCPSRDGFGRQCDALCGLHVCCAVNARGVGLICAAMEPLLRAHGHHHHSYYQFCTCYESSNLPDRGVRSTLPCCEILHSHSLQREHRRCSFSRNHPTWVLAPTACSAAASFTAANASASPQQQLHIMSLIQPRAAVQRV